MIKCGGSIRFTSREVEEFREIGLNFSDARNQRDVEQELGRWAELVAQERPDLLDKIGRAMIEMKHLECVSKSAGGARDDL